MQIHAVWHNHSYITVAAGQNIVPVHQLVDWPVHKCNSVKRGNNTLTTQLQQCACRARPVDILALLAVHASVHPSSHLHRWTFIRIITWGCCLNNSQQARATDRLHLRCMRNEMHEAGGSSLLEREDSTLMSMLDTRVMFHSRRPVEKNLFRWVTVSHNKRADHTISTDHIIKARSRLK